MKTQNAFGDGMEKVKRPTLWMLFEMTTSAVKLRQCDIARKKR